MIDLNACDLFRYVNNEINKHNNFNLRNASLIMYDDILINASYLLVELYLKGYYFVNKLIIIFMIFSYFRLKLMYINLYIPFICNILSSLLSLFSFYHHSWHILSYFVLSTQTYFHHVSIIYETTTLSSTFSTEKLDLRILCL